jgi:glycosyltransferase involved in cell wall biosynthesis
MSAAQSARRRVRTALRTVVPPTIAHSRVAARLWTATVSAPGLPDAVRFELADRVHSSLIDAGLPGLAAQVSHNVLRRIKRGRLRSDLLLRHTNAQIRFGTPPGLTAAAAAELAFADKSLAKGDIPGSVASVQAVQRLLFDRRLQFDRLTSPLTEDAGRFLAAWHDSTAVRALSAPRGRSGAAAPPPPGRPVRLLLATYGNHGFIELIRQHFDEMPGVEVRFFDPTGDAPGIALMSNQRSMAEHILSRQSAYGDKVAAWLQPQVEWADVVFVDWCAALAVLFSMIDPGSTRIVVRLHSFEAFTAWPHLVDFSRVDDVIFVSDHLRDLVTAAVPGVTSGSPRLHVIANAMDLQRFAREKDPGARFTLAVVGIKAVAKDPRWAVEVLRRLRTQDDRYRLILFGDDPNAAASEDAGRYVDLLHRDIADLEPSGIVARPGHVGDMPDALSDVGVVVSSSVRESFHCGLVEGAASGAIPVVRDWPFFAGRNNGAGALFPPEWVVDTPQEAADRILAATASEDLWRKTGAEASDHALAAWDWAVVKHQFDWVVGGDSDPSGAAIPDRPAPEDGHHSTGLSGRDVVEPSQPPGTPPILNEREVST